MPSWKKVIVSGSQAHLQGITASQVPTGTTENVLVISTTGEIKQVSQGTLTGQSIKAFSTASAGGTQLFADNANGNLTIASGSFGGAATTNNNLLISASAGNDTITFSLRDNLSVTSMTASNGYLLSNSNDGRQYSTNGGTTASLNTITFRDTDTTSDVTQSIGRIAFESFDTDTSGSNNSQVVRAFIEAVSEDTSPDTFLAFGTAQSGSLAQERMRINASGSVGIGVTAPTNTLQVGGTGIATTNLTASGNISSSAGLIGATLTTSGDASITGRLNANGAITTTNITASGIISSSSTLIGAALATSGQAIIGGNLRVDGNTTLGDTSADTASIGAGRVIISNLPAGTSELAVLVTGSNGQVFTRQLAASAFSGGSGVSGTGTVDRLVLWSGSSGTTSVTNDDPDLSFNRSTNVLTIGNSTFGNSTSINTDLTVGGSATITGNLTVNGTTTILNVDTVMVEDRFILLASGSISGSATHADGGIIVQYTTGSGGSPTGSALFLNSNVSVTSPPNNQTFSARWGLNNSVGHTQTTLNPTDYLVSVTRSGAVPTTAPEFGGQLLGFGNMYIQNNGDIWFWSPDLADAEGNIVYAG